MKRRSISIALLGTLFWFSSFQSSEACTLWGATGQSVEGGGTLIAKNRDWAPVTNNQLIYSHAVCNRWDEIGAILLDSRWSDNGYRYFISYSIAVYNLRLHYCSTFLGELRIVISNIPIFNSIEPQYNPIAF